MVAAIHAIGAATPLGNNWQQTREAYGQGRKRLLRDKSVIGPDGLPARLAPVHPFHTIHNPPLRLARLAAAAINDLLDQAAEAALGATLVLIVPQWAGQDAHKAALLAYLADSTPFPAEAVSLVYSDQTTIPELILTASTAQGPQIIAVVDSLLISDLLDSLSASNRILTRDQPHGLIPGEAATAFLVGPLTDAAPQPLAVLRASCAAQEEQDLRRPDGLLGQPLAGLLGRLLDADHRPQRLLSDLNGERWRSEEIAVVLARHTDRLPEDLPNQIEAPASQLGYCGAAMSGLLLALACIPAPGIDTTPAVTTALILISQYGGLRTAAVIQRFERTGNDA